MAKLSGRLLATALAVCLAGASGARAEYMGWTYSFADSGLAISPNAGGASGSIGVALPQGGSASTSIPSIILEASTSALGTIASPADQFVNVPYSVTLAVTDPTANQSHSFTFNGLINGTATVGNYQITDTFPGGSSQSYSLGGNDYDVTVGPFALSATTGSGSIGFAVQVTSPVAPPPPSPPAPPSPPSPPISPPAQSSPEPCSLVLACLALPALGCVNWKRRNALVSCS